MNWDEVRELAPLFVIGALDADTAREVESSLRNATPEQQRDLAEWREVTALLPYALPQPAPPSTLRERLLDSIGSDSQESPIETAISESAQERVDRKLLKFPPARQTEPRASRWLLIAAVALLTSSTAYLLWQNVTLARDRDRISNELAALQQQVDEFVSPATRVISMSSDEAPQANAKIIWDTRSQQWIIHIFALPAPPADKAYQLWYVTKDAKISAAVFRTDEKGRNVLKLSLPPEAITGLAATAVTLEPSGGSQQPTGKFYLKAAVSNSI
jgi:anti-sigma-K factor RskA